MAFFTLVCANRKLCFHHFLNSFLLSVGGVRKDMYNFLPRQMQSRHGFEGCLASLDLNGESPDTTLDALVPSPLVVPGCEGEVSNTLLRSYSPRIAFMF